MTDEERKLIAEEREAIFQWLRLDYVMPGALAQLISKQHKLGGELILWAKRKQLER